VARDAVAIAASEDGWPDTIHSNKYRKRPPRNTDHAESVDSHEDCHGDCGEACRLSSIVAL
jgi:hypothetical protein